MKVILSPEAIERLQAQIAYLDDAEASAAADRLSARVTSFWSNHLAHFPRAGRRLEPSDLWECGFLARDWFCGIESRRTGS